MKFHHNLLKENTTSTTISINNKTNDDLNDWQLYCLDNEFISNYNINDNKSIFNRLINLNISNQPIKNLTKQFINDSTTSSLNNNESIIKSSCIKINKNNNTIKKSKSETNLSLIDNNNEFIKTKKDIINPLCLILNTCNNNLNDNDDDLFKLKYLYEKYLREYTENKYYNLIINNKKEYKLLLNKQQNIHLNQINILNKDNENQLKLLINDLNELNNKLIKTNTKLEYVSFKYILIFAFILNLFLIVSFFLIYIVDNVKS